MFVVLQAIPADFAGDYILSVGWQPQLQRPFAMMVWVPAPATILYTPAVRSATDLDEASIHHGEYELHHLTLTILSATNFPDHVLPHANT